MSTPMNHGEHRSGDSGSSREALQSSIQSGIKLPDEPGLLTDLISLINQIENLEPAVTLLFDDASPASDFERKHLERHRRRLLGQVRVAKSLASRMWRHQLARFIFMRRAHFAFTLSALAQRRNAIGNSNEPAVAADHQQLTRRIKLRWSQELDCIVAQEIEYLRHCVRSPGVLAETADSPDLVENVLDTLMRAPQLDEVAIYTDIFHLLNLALVVARCLREGDERLGVVCSNFGPQPAAHTAKLIEGQCRKWRRLVIPELLQEQLRLNLEVAVLAAGELEDVGIFSSAWQQKIWPGWIGYAAEQELPKAQKLVDDVRKLHRLETDLAE